MLYHNDLNDIYQVVEETIGVNIGINNVLYNIKGIIGAGVGHATRYYYVPVVFPNGTTRFNAVLVTVRPLSAPKRSSGVLMNGASTYAAILSAIALAPGITGDTSAPTSAAANMLV